MVEYIKREAALNFRLNVRLRPNELTAAQAVADAIMAYIKAIPSADVVPVVHGQHLVRSHHYSGRGGRVMIRRLCKDCKHNDENGFCNDCGYFYREMTASGGTASDSRGDQATRKTTNADRVRAMTDEELAQLLRDYGCNRCEWYGLCEVKAKDECGKEILDWLKQEADNG